MKTRLSPLRGAPDVEELSQEQWVSRRTRYRQGAEHGVKQLSTGRDDGARRSRGRAALQRGNARYYPGSGPSERGKPLCPACGVLHCLERFTVQGELVGLEVATMSKNPRSWNLPSVELGRRVEPFARTGSSSFYRRLGPILPKHLGGKGYHIATKEEAGCTVKVVAMDVVHGRRRRHQS